MSYRDQMGGIDTTATVGGPAGMYHVQTGIKANAHRRVNLFPDLLAERLEKYGITPPDFAPVFDRFLLCPLGDADQADKVGSLYVPTETKDKLGAERGLLIAAGARAHEELYAHGIELGHILIVSKFSVWTRTYVTAKGMARVLLCRSADVAASEDVLRAYKDGQLWLERDASTGRVELGDRGRIDPPDHDEV